MKPITNLSLTRPLNRRTFFKGIGAAMALPSSIARAFGSCPEAPKRMAWVPACVVAIAGLAFGGCSRQDAGDANLAMALPEAVDFNFHVKPILSDRCFFCHGPDGEQRKAGLRIDTAEGALEHVLESGRLAFVAGDAAASEAYLRMVSDDPETVMPPPDSNLALTDYEKAVIEKWIQQGAEYKEHWAYSKIDRQEPPETKNRSWIRNPIDAFVMKRLEREGLKPAPEAERETLIRRVTFDLTGLPPAPAEIDAFLADRSPDAYERLVDDLLTRESYGERMAVEWMDVSRFADTHGYSIDRYRDMSPWRDWVISTFNENMPFDDFVTWQIAGDLLPNPTRDQRLATAFNRLHPQNGEGGIVNEEFRMEYVADRVLTLGTAFLGATMECTRCHDHKYDPILQEEFYGLASFFNNIDESGQISFDSSDMPVPTMLMPDGDQEAALGDLESKIAAQEGILAAATGSTRTTFEQWRNAGKPSEWDLKATDALMARFPIEAEDSNESIRNTVDEAAPGKVIFGSNVKTSDGPAMRHVALDSRRAVRLSGDDPLYFPSTSGFSRATPFSVSIDAWVPMALEEGTLFHYNKAGILYNYKGFEVSLSEGRWDVRMAHTFPYNAIHLLSEEPVKKEIWQQVTLVYDGSSKAAGVVLYVDGEAVAMSVKRDNLYKDFKHSKANVAKEVGIKVGGRWRSKGFPGGLVDELRVYSRALSSLEIAALAGKSDLRGNADEEALRAFYDARYNQEYRLALGQLSALRAEYSALKEPIQEIMVMDEMPEARQAYLLVRGAYDAKGDPVDAAAPVAILPFSEELPKNRLGVAKWLTSPDHPLTSRVTVNRYWQIFFGKGIVGTTDDFGSQGDLPTHPDLLDWLAFEFIDSGWDVKGILKTIATSATYRQSSRAESELRLSDPKNLLLARGPQQRLTAEMLRDNVLAASGLMVRKIGGPSVYPYQPEGLWEMNKGEYVQGKGDDLYRRSLYTIWKRSVPPPSMNGFDVPTRAYCSPERQQTNTPLQALTLMNDPQLVEAARVLAAKVLEEHGSEAKRLESIYRLLTSRVPALAERRALSSMLESALISFGNSPARADAFLSVGEFPLPDEIDSVELAAYGVVANLVMNHDATVMKR